MPIGDWLFWLWAILVAVLGILVAAVLLTGRALEHRLAAIQALLERMADRDSDVLS